MFPNIQSGKKYTIGYIETKISFATKTQCFQFKELINMGEFVLLCNGPHTVLSISQNTQRGYR